MSEFRKTAPAVATSDDGVRIEFLYQNGLLLYEINGEQYLLGYEHGGSHDERGKLTREGADWFFPLHLAYRRDEEDLPRNLRRRLPDEVLDRMRADLPKGYAVMGIKCYFY